MTDAASTKELEGDCPATAEAKDVAMNSESSPCPKKDSWSPRAAVAFSTLDAIQHIYSLSKRVLTTLQGNKPNPKESCHNGTSAAQPAGRPDNLWT